MEGEILETRRLTDQPFGVNFHMFQANAAEIVELVLRHSVGRSATAVRPDKQDDRASEGRRRGVHSHRRCPQACAESRGNGRRCGHRTGRRGRRAYRLGAHFDCCSIRWSTRSSVPVVAAGGFKDGRGLASALAYGAEGIAMGTRFLMMRRQPGAAGDPGALPAVNDRSGDHHQSRDGRHAATDDSQTNCSISWSKGGLNVLLLRIAAVAWRTAAHWHEPDAHALSALNMRGSGELTRRAKHHGRQRADGDPESDGRRATRPRACCPAGQVAGVHRRACPAAPNRLKASSARPKQRLGELCRRVSSKCASMENPWNHLTSQSITALPNWCSTSHRSTPSTARAGPISPARSKASGATPACG